MRLPGRPGIDFVSLSGINDYGVVVGTWVGGGGPFKWTKEEGLTTLDLLGGRSGEATAINNLGEIVGFVFDGNELFGVKWTACGASRLARLPNRVPQDAFHGLETTARAINDRGAVVGNDSTNGQFVAIQWESTTRVAPLPLGAISSSASDVNDCGYVVGIFEPAPNVSHPYLWQPARAAQ